jgi:hypothetical protein
MRIIDGRVYPPGALMYIKGEYSSVQVLQNAIAELCAE